MDIFTNSSVYSELLGICMYTNPSVSIWEKRRISKKIRLFCTYIKINSIHYKTDKYNYDKMLYVAVR